MTLTLISVENFKEKFFFIDRKSFTPEMGSVPENGRQIIMTLVDTKTLKNTCINEVFYI